MKACNTPGIIALPEDLQPALGAVCCQFEDQWRSGSHPPIADFLRDRAEPERSALLYDLLLLDLEFRRERNENPTEHDYRKDFPDDTHVIAKAFADDTCSGVPAEHREGVPSPEASLEPAWPETAGNVAPAFAAAGDAIAGVHEEDIPAITRGDTVWEQPTSARTAEPTSADFDDFVDLRELGKGGMGKVYLARQRSLNRLVALKVIRSSALIQDQSRERFESEAKAAARLRHPNIVQIYLTGTDKRGRKFLALEYMDGGDLGTWLKEAPLLPRQAAFLVETIARAIQAAHEMGIIHRDLKPANILLKLETGSGAGSSDRTMTDGHAQDTGAGRVSRSTLKAGADAPAGPRPQVTPKVADFGLAKQLDNDQSLTVTGQPLGTPYYMSPEQAAGQAKATPQMDVYGLGAILYETLTGRPPFKGPTFAETLHQVREVEPVAPRRLQPSVPRDLETICLKCLEKKPEKRYPSAQALADDLRRFQQGEPITARPAGALERMTKWVRRKPSLAGLIGAAILLVCAGVGLAAHVAYAQAEKKRAAFDYAEKVLERKREVDQRDYDAIINQAHRAWERGQPHLTLQLLDSRRPERTDGGLDYRGWEWHYLKRLCHSETLLLKGHTGAIRCVAYSPDGTLVASGSNDGTARLWDATTGKTLHVLSGHLLGVTCIAFSHDGKLLATGSEDTTVKLWDVATGAVVDTLTGHVLAVNSVAFAPKSKLKAMPALATAASDDTIQLYDLVTRKRVRVIQGHRGEVNCLIFSPDGTKLATAGTDHSMPTVRLRDVASGTGLTVFDGNTNYLFFTPDGKRLGFGGINDLRMVDLETRKIVFSITHSSRLLAPAVLADVHHTFNDGGSVSGFVRPSRGFSHAALSPDGKRICTVDRGKIQIWDAATGKELHALRAQGSFFAWHPDGRQLAAPGDDHCVRIWSITVDQEGWTTGGRHLGRIASLAFSPDGKRIASGSHDHSIKILNADTGKELVNLGRHQPHFRRPDENQPPVLVGIDTLEGHREQVNRVAFSPDGRWLASAGQDKTLRVWDAASGKESLKLQFPAAVTSVAWNPDGKRLAAGSWDDDVHLFEFPSGQLIRKLEGHTGNVAAVAFLRGGKFLASAGRDETVRLWEVDTGRQVNVFRGPHLGWLSCMSLSPDQQLLVIAGEDMVITVLDTASWTEKRKLWGHAARIDDLAFSPDGRRLVSVSGAGKTGINVTGSVKLWNVTTGLELLDLPGVFAVTFSSDGRRIAAGTRSNQVRIYESAPVDSQSYRTAPYEAPAPEAAQSSDDGRLRVLGHATARRLTGTFGAPKVLKPSEVGHDFLLAVVSLPHRFFIPSEQSYASMRELEQKRGEDPSPKREKVAVYNSRRFRLVLPKGKIATGQLVGFWASNHSHGFTSSIQLSSSARIRPHERAALIIAWSVDRKDIEWPLQIRIDEHELVPVPEVRLVLDPSLLASSPRERELNDRVERAEKKVKTARYIEAATEALLAASDHEAHPITIYNAACVHALAAARAYQDSMRPLSEREKRAEQFARQAVILLRRADAAGFFRDPANVSHLDRDEDLTFLRNREDYRRFCAGLTPPK